MRRFAGDCYFYSEGPDGLIVVLGGALTGAISIVIFKVVRPFIITISGTDLCCAEHYQKMNPTAQTCSQLNALL